MAYDNACKYLAEQYPAQFALWLLSSDTSDIRVLKTELNLEPIRVDSVTFLQVSNQILHLNNAGCLVAPKGEYQGIKGIDTHPVFISGLLQFLESLVF